MLRLRLIQSLLSLQSKLRAFVQPMGSTILLGSMATGLVRSNAVDDSKEYPQKIQETISWCSTSSLCMTPSVAQIMCYMCYIKPYPGAIDPGPAACYRPWHRVCSVGGQRLWFCWFWVASDRRSRTVSNSKGIWGISGTAAYCSIVNSTHPKVGGRDPKRNQLSMKKWDDVEWPVCPSPWPLPQSDVAPDLPRQTCWLHSTRTYQLL